jgi:hypothetical protein
MAKKNKEPDTKCQHPAKAVEAYFDHNNDEIYYVCHACGKRAEVCAKWFYGHDGE